MNNLELENLISAWLDGNIDEAQSTRLQEKLIESASARRRFREMANLESSLRGMATGELGSNPVTELPLGVREQEASSVNVVSGIRSLPLWASLAAAALLMVTVGGVAYSIGSADGKMAASGEMATPGDVLVETKISGHATLRRAAGIKWSNANESYYEGDLLPSGMLQFDAGVAEIDFFCGATVVVEGPAQLDLESDWELRLIGGRLRANVPPAARGFTVKAADSEIIDLGTEFALEVDPDHVHVAVVDGEIKLNGGKHDGQHLFAGEARSLSGDAIAERAEIDVRSLGDIKRLHANETAERFAKWKSAANKLAQDDRLIAFYPISGHASERFAPNLAPSGSEFDGKIIGPVDVGQGRFGDQSKGFGFGRPGARVRALVGGEFKAFTFSCWVKIDSLDHKYNALFMSDGYENGELHWQVHNDGRMMFSVMVDDTPGAGHGPSPDSRFHHIYYTPPIWDMTKAGKWMHLAAVYDPASRRVDQYVNGQRISTEPITDKFYVESLRIGPAEIGNWGQPLRKSPDFAVRNLNGAIDEIAIFKEALGAEEITSIYDNGKPFAY
jgi:hypothetical protein